MKIVMQRVNYARLTSEDFESSIGFGLLITVGVSRDDTDFDIDYLAKKVATLRQFKDEEDRINKSLLDVQGEVLCVSNFTLQGRLKSGTRPDFSLAGDSEEARIKYLQFADKIREYGVKVELGNFKHHMHIDCSLDGPFTIILESVGRTHE